MNNNIVALNFETRKISQLFKTLCMLVTLSLILFQFCLETNIYFNIRASTKTKYHVRKSWNENQLCDRDTNQSANEFNSWRRYRCAQNTSVQVFDWLINSQSWEECDRLQRDQIWNIWTLLKILCLRRARFLIDW